MLNEERKSLNKTKMLSVWSGKNATAEERHQIWCHKLVYTDSHMSGCGIAFLLQKHVCPSYNGSCWPHHQVRSLVGWQGTSARLATLTKLRPFLERQLLFLFSSSNRQCSLRGRVPDLVSLLVAYAEQVLQP